MLAIRPSIGYNILSRCILYRHITIRLVSSAGSRPGPRQVKVTIPSPRKSTPTKPLVAAVEMPIALPGHMLAKLTAAADRGDVGEFVSSLTELVHTTPHCKPSPDLLELMTRIANHTIQETHLIPLLTAMSSMGVQINGTSLEYTLLCKCLQHLTEASLDTKHTVAVLQALSKMVRWSALPAPTQHALWTAIERISTSLMDADTATCAQLIHALGAIGFNHTPSQRIVLLQIAKQGISRTSALNSALTLEGMAQLSLWHATLPEEMQKHMERCLQRILPALNTQDLVAVVGSLGLLSWSWSASAYVAMSLQDTLVRQLPSMSASQVASILQSLVAMDAKWSKLPVKLRDALSVTVTSLTSKSLGQQTEPILVSYVLSLGKMHAQWSSLSTPFMQSIAAFMAFKKRLPSSWPQVIYGLGLMGARAADLPKESIKGLNKRLQAAAAAWTAKELADVCLGLGHMEVAWKDLPPDTACALADAWTAQASSMKPHELGNGMYGLVMMCFDFQHTLASTDSRAKAGSAAARAAAAAACAHAASADAMWKTIRAAARRFGQFVHTTFMESNQSQCAIFFAWLAGAPGGKEMITELVGSQPLFTSQHEEKSTDLHRALSSALPIALEKIVNGRFFIVDEFNGLDGVFATDMAVFHDNELLAFVEVDGPDHFSADGTELKRRLVLKAFLYAQRYPDVIVHHVRNEQIMAKRMEQEVTLLAQRILGHAYIQKGRK